MKRALREARERVVGLNSRFNGAAARRRVSESLWAQCLVLFAFGVLGSSPAWSQTQVTSITASPSSFNAFIGESTTFTVAATPGVTQLDVHVLTADLSRTIKTGLALVEGAAGSYSVVWNGRSDSNAIATAGNYAVRVFNRATTTYLGPISSVTVQGLAFSPTTITPTGFNSVDFTVQATPGQTGLRLYMYTRVGSNTIYWYGPGCTFYTPLTETSPGTYTLQWNAVQASGCSGGPYVMPDGSYTVVVIDAANNQSTWDSAVSVQAVSAVTASPSAFNAAGGETTTITATGVAGLNLEGRVYQGTTLIRTLPVTAADTSYTTVWDGRDEAGALAPVGSYQVGVGHVGSPAPYYPRPTVQVSAGVTSVTASPNPFAPTGSNSTTLTVNATPGQTGLNVYVYVRVSGNTIYWYGPGCTFYTPLTETSPGAYTLQWNAVQDTCSSGPFLMPDGSYTVVVRDAAGNSSTWSNAFAVRAPTTVSATPNPFTPGGTNVLAISVTGPSGLGLEARVINTVTSAVTRNLPLVEIGGGSYSTTWDGRDNFGNFAGANSYRIDVYATGGTVRYYPTRTITVKAAVFAISASPDPFTPDGTNFTTITVLADPLQTGWTAKITDTAGNTTGALPLTEVGSQGTYTTNWDGKINGVVPDDGVMTIRVYDTAGNLFPATGTVTIDSTPPPVGPEPASNFTATATDKGIRLGWTHSPSENVAGYRIYWNAGSGDIDYGHVYSSVLYPANTYTVTTLPAAGTYRFGLRAVDRDGVEEQNTTVTASILVEAFSVTVAVGTGPFDRGQDIEIAGSVEFGAAAPVADVPVQINIRSATSRTFTVYTDAQGAYRYVFRPLAGEAGSYTVEAVVVRNGLRRSVMTGFQVLGLWLQPSSMSLQMSMNATQTVEFTVSNVGDVGLSGLQYAVEDLNPADPLTAAVTAAGLPDTLMPGAKVTVPLVLTSMAGTAPNTPAQVQVRVMAAEGSVETAVVTATLKNAVAEPVITPQPFKVGVKPGESVTRTVTVTNGGYAAIAAANLVLREAASYSWVQVLSGELGGLEPQQAKEVQLRVSPPAESALGVHFLHLDLTYDGKTRSATVEIEIVATETGVVAAQVHDDTGSVVSGADVALISKAFNVSTAPDGSTKEYPNVIQGKTNATGQLTFNDVPAGEYRYQVQAAGHDPFEGEVRVEAGTEPQALNVILVTNLVDVSFKVTPTTISDEYDITLQITYTTNLTKPALYASPAPVHLSFFPEETQSGTLTIRNTSNNAPVRGVVMNAADLDTDANEIEVVFANGLKAILLPDLGPGESVQVPYTARIVSANPQLNTRNAGNITVSGKYTYSINGEAFEGTTTTPIPVLFTRPRDLRLPAVVFTNDETDGDLTDLQYEGTTYRLAVASNRNVSFDFGPDLKAISHINGGTDPAAVLAQNTPFWTDVFNSPPPLAAKGNEVTFDIDGLGGSLEGQMNADRAGFLGRPRSIGFKGQWADRGTNPDTYLIPITIISIRPSGISVGSCLSCGGGWSVPQVPTLRMPQGEVKIEIKQKTALEREAFDVALGLTPTVSQLDNVSVRLNVVDAGGADASGLFYQIVTQQSGIPNLAGSTVTGPANIGWQLVPSSTAGGTEPTGRVYAVSATIQYTYQGTTRTYDTAAQSITVLPMPKLTLEYTAPFVVMAGEPAYIRVKVSNNGAGAANGLTIESAQPEIVDNPNGVPVAFSIVGSSPTGDPSGFQPDEMTIDFGTVAASGTAQGYWDLRTTLNGYFVDFTATVKHRNYLGVELDPLIESVTTTLVPAVGGILTVTGCDTPPALEVQLLQGGAVVAADAVREDGVYFIPDLTAGEYLWQVVDGLGAVLSSRTITVLADQPTARLEDTVEGCVAQSTYEIAPASQTVNEAAGVVTFTVSRTPSTAAETVYVSTVQNQGFTNQDDYTGKLNEPLAFGAGVASQTVTVTVLDDAVAEAQTETFGLIVQRNSGDAIADALAAAVFSITDDDVVVQPPAFGVDPRGTLPFEPTPVKTASYTTFTITNLGAGTLTGTCAVGAPFSLPNGCSYSLDAGVSKSISVRFFPTEATDYRVPIVFDDNSPGPHESLHAVGTGTGSSGPGSVFSIVSTNANKIEGTNSDTIFSFRVDRAGGTSRASWVRWEVYPGPSLSSKCIGDTLTVGDFVVTSPASMDTGALVAGELPFDENVTSNEMQLHVYGDSDYECDEAFDVHILPVRGDDSIDPLTYFARGIIVNDDQKRDGLPLIKGSEANDPLVAAAYLSLAAYSGLADANVTQMGWQPVPPEALGIANGNGWMYRDGVFTADFIYDDLPLTEAAHVYEAVLGGKRTLAIAFRGTAEDTAKLQNGELVAQALSGWSPLYETLRPLVNAVDNYVTTWREQDQEKGRGFEQLVITGHSLGGALAQKFIIDKVLNGQWWDKNIIAITFGSPGSEKDPAGNASGVGTTGILNLVHDDDIVPNLVGIRSARYGHDLLIERPEFAGSVPGTIEHDKNLYLETARSIRGQLTTLGLPYSLSELETTYADRFFAAINSQKAKMPFYVCALRGGDASRPLIAIGGNATNTMNLGCGVSDAFIIGGSKADAIVGSAHNDVLMGAAGNDTLDGGDGVDSAVFRGPLAGFDRNVLSGSVVIKDKSGREGTDTLTNVELVLFDDWIWQVNTGAQYSRSVDIATGLGVPRPIAELLMRQQ